MTEEIKKPANPVGRPTKYKEEYCEMLIDHMAQGLSYESFAAIAKVDRDTLYNWEKLHPKFSDTKRLAFAESQLFWEKAGLTGMFMGGKENPFNATIWVFNMKNRFNWVDKKEVTNENKNIEIKIDDDDSKL